jgi:hypothetical protein
MRVEVVSAAVPLLTAPVPRIVELSKNVTVPVAFVGMVAINVTDWLTFEGLTDESSNTVMVALVTICVVPPVAGLLFVSPPKLAVMGSVPTGRDVVDMTTVPVVGFTVPLPSVTPPLETVTVPVVPGGKVVVIVTDPPEVLGPEVVTVTGGVILLTV